MCLSRFYASVLRNCHSILPLSILSGAFIYAGLIVTGATICFWTIKTPEIINAFTFGGQQLTSLPLSIYDRWIRVVFLSIAPVAFASYPAALLILGRSDPRVARLDCVVRACGRRRVLRRCPGVLAYRRAPVPEHRNLMPATGVSRQVPGRSRRSKRLRCGQAPEADHHCAIRRS